MKIRRLVASVSAGFEEFVNKVENHEAVAESLIGDARRAAARIRVQMGRANGQMVRLKRELASVNKDRHLWESRALAVADDNPDTALACMQRLEDAENRAQALEEQIRAHETLNVDLSEALADVEQRIRNLELRRTSLSSREARASLTRLGPLQSNTLCDAERAFERWESAVVEDEYRGGFNLPGDALDREFVAEERRETLRARLELLRAQRQPNDNQEN